MTTITTTSLNNLPILMVNPYDNNMVRYNSISAACSNEQYNFNAHEIEIAILSNITYRGYIWKVDEMEQEILNTDTDIEIK